MRNICPSQYPFNRAYKLIGSSNRDKKTRWETSRHIWQASIHYRPVCVIGDVPITHHCRFPIAFQDGLWGPFTIQLNTYVRFFFTRLLLSMLVRCGSRRLAVQQRPLCPVPSFSHQIKICLAWITEAISCEPSAFQKVSEIIIKKNKKNKTEINIGHTRLGNRAVSHCCVQMGKLIPCLRTPCDIYCTVCKKYRCDLFMPYCIINHYWLMLQRAHACLLCGILNVNMDFFSCMLNSFKLLQLLVIELYEMNMERLNQFSNVFIRANIEFYFAEGYTCICSMYCLL